MVSDAIRHRQKLSNCCKKFVAFLFSQVGLATMVVAYSIMGGFLFQALEAPYESDVRFQVRSHWNLTLDGMWKKLTLRYQNRSGVWNRTSFDEDIGRILNDFQRNITGSVKERGWDGKDDSSVQWSFAGSLLYAVTVITTIGYGHVAPKTSYGRFVTIIYALVGIPLTFLYLSIIGNYLAECFRIFYRKICCDILCCLSCERSKRRQRQLLRQKRQLISTQTSNVDGSISNDCVVPVTGARNQTRIQQFCVEQSSRPIPKYGTTLTVNDNVINCRDVRQKGSPNLNVSAQNSETSGVVDVKDRTPLIRRCQSEKRSRGKLLPAKKENPRAKERLENLSKRTRNSRNFSDAEKGRMLLASSDIFGKDGAMISKTKDGRDVQEVTQTIFIVNHTPGSFMREKKLKTALSLDADVPPIAPTPTLSKSASARESASPNVNKRSKNDKKTRASGRSLIKRSIRRSASFDSEFKPPIDIYATLTGSNIGRGVRESEESFVTAVDDLELFSSSDGEDIDNIKRASSNRLATADRNCVDAGKPPEKSNSCSKFEDYLKTISAASALPAPMPRDEIHYEEINGDDVIVTTLDCATYTSGCKSNIRFASDPGPPSAVSSYAKNYDDAKQRKIRVPICVCLAVIASYILAGSVLFTLWEDWDLLTGSYFCFITLSTIGFGDIVPGTDIDKWNSREKLVLCALWLALGLSLLAMCFNLMQEEVKEKCKWLALKLGLIKNESAAAV